jgi:cytochrome b involved in lipid metabolism
LYFVARKDAAGQEDATDLFEDIGHSDEAREDMQEFLIGAIKKE